MRPSADKTNTISGKPVQDEHSKIRDLLKGSRTEKLQRPRHHGLICLKVDPLSFHVRFSPIRDHAGHPRARNGKKRVPSGEAQIFLSKSAPNYCRTPTSGPHVSYCGTSMRYLIRYLSYPWEGICGD